MNKKLPLSGLINQVVTHSKQRGAFFINFIKGSCQDELDHSFKALFRLDVPVVFVTKMALSLARRKLKNSAFIEYNWHLLDFFYDHFRSTLHERMS